jgi:PAS domain S-box-containing protein
VLENQGLLSLAFFEATALILLLVLFFLVQRNFQSGNLRLWLGGWIFLTFSSLFEIGVLLREGPALRMAWLAAHAAALLLFLAAVMRFVARAQNQSWPFLPLGGAILLGICYMERTTPAHLGAIRWETAGLESGILLWAGWLLWRKAGDHAGHGVRLLGGALLVNGLHGMDRWLWLESPIFHLRMAFDHLLWVAVGIAVMLLLLEATRARSEELNEKLRRLSLLTAASMQTHSVQEVIDRVLGQLVESMGASHGIVRLLEGEGEKACLVIRASVGFSDAYVKQHARLKASERWTQEMLKQDCHFLRIDEGESEEIRRRMADSGLRELVTMKLPGKDGPLGLISIGSGRSVRFQPDEISYLLNITNQLGLTLQNVRLFEQVAKAQRQWEYTFDSIGDPILVHDGEFRVLRSNQRTGQLLGRTPEALAGRQVSEILSRTAANYKGCPYCEGVAGEGDEADPWLSGHFLASNSPFIDQSGRQQGTVHVLKDITDRKRAEEKYRALVANVQEGVFISTPQGRFLDFNDALMRILGYENREELLAAEVTEIYVNAGDRERFKRLLQEHNSVADFEFELRRKDGETRTVLESSMAVRDAAGNVTAYQGFLLDITERKRAELEIRHRNRELMVLNSIAQTLSESIDLPDSLHRTLRQLSELFGLDTASLYLFESEGGLLRRMAAVGLRSELSRHSAPVKVEPRLLSDIRALRATFLPVQSLPLPAVFREVYQREGLLSAYVVILWSKERPTGGLVVGCRSQREFSPADINLLIAAGSQISSAIERTRLYEETRHAYENLRLTQEQLLQSEKMAAVGQLISGVAHELNNPLTAILGYSQLLTSSGEVGAHGLEYSEKLYKQAQRTHRIVQNLLSFARQHKPERVPAQINQIIEDTLALREYDLRANNIRVHLELEKNLPITAADPHQLQQVFLNMINNALDAILDHAKEGDLWVKTCENENGIVIEFTDSGRGVQEASRVFDPFYTTKPVGKGTGLGLSICYGIVTEHGGTIRVKNVHPRGASFTIELPYQPATSGEKQPAALRGGEGNVEARILVVDQDQSVLEAISAVLRGRYQQVKSCGTAEEAISLLQEQDFDIVLADVNAPVDEDVLKLRKWLEDNKPMMSQRVILMRASAPAAAPGESGQADGDGCPILQKPFKAAELLALVENTLGQVDAAPMGR